MNTRNLLVSLTLVASLLGLAACSGGGSSSGFMPSTQTSATRAPLDVMIPHV